MQEEHIEFPEVTEKLWGSERNIVTNKEYTGKILNINPGFISSIHAHEKKLETFYVREGVVVLSFYRNGKEKTSVFGEIAAFGEYPLLEQTDYLLTPGMAITIERKQYHSFKALSPAEVFEFSTPHADEDVDRLRESRPL